MPSVTNPNKVDRSTLPDPHQEPLSKVQLLVDNKIRNLEKRKVSVFYLEIFFFFLGKKVFFCSFVQY